VQASDELADGLGLVAARLHGGYECEVGHGGRERSRRGCQGVSGGCVSLDLQKMVTVREGPDLVESLDDSTHLNLGWSP
jgi:hypothetical protein